MDDSFLYLLSGIAILVAVTVLIQLDSWLIMD